MKHLPSPSIIYKYAMSYLTITAVLTALLGGLGFSLFNNSYKTKVDELNMKMLTHQASLIEGIMDEIEGTCLEMLSVRDTINTLTTFTRLPLEGNHVMILDIKSILDAQLEKSMYLELNRRIIERIHIYYRDAQIIISSQYGLKYLSTNHLYEEQDWLSLPWDTVKDGYWINTRAVPISLGVPSDTANYITYVRTYPSVKAASQEKARIAFDLSADVLRQVLAEYMPELYEYSLILSDQNDIIADYHESGAEFRTKLDDLSVYFGGNENGSGNFTLDIDGLTYYAAFVVIPELNWKIIDFTPADTYYIENRRIAKVFALLSCGAVIAAIALSLLFSKRFYSPLNDIIQKIQTRRHEIPSAKLDQARNEYDILNTALDQLSENRLELLRTLNHNIPLVRYHLAIDLIYGRLHEDGNLKNRCAMAKIDLPYRWFRAVIIDPQFDRGNTIDDGQKQLLLLSLMEEATESAASLGSAFGTQLQNNDICIIINSNRNDIGTIVDWSEGVIREYRKKTNTDIHMSIGECADRFSGIKDSYHSALIKLKYHYYQPDMNILYDHRLLERDENKDRIPGVYFNNIKESLYENNIRALTSAFNAFVKLCRDSEYAASQCEQVCHMIVNEWLAYSEIVGFQMKESDIRNIDSFVSGFLDIQELKNAIVNLTEQIFCYSDDLIHLRRKQSILDAKQYIQENLDAPLSLESIAEQCSLSSKYFSLIFKKETGIGFNQYLTRCRMEAAAHLLKKTEYTVDQVGEMVGYHAPGYLNRLFKRFYGITPNEFRKKEKV